ncbi:MAG: hypothetical protein K8F93_16320 [Burkholderiales bacterium]|nr:hypothetical protein [Burkholderiales bacterium]
MAATVKKVSLAIGREELAWARKRAKHEGRSVSSVLTEVVRLARQAEIERARRRDAWSEVLAWALEGQPPFSPEEHEDALRELDPT